MIKILSVGARVALVCSVALMAACATKGGLYQRAKTISDLEIPPDLTKPVEDTTYEIPGFGALVAREVSLSDGDSVRLVRDGGVQYLEFHADAQRLWQRVRQFWLDRDVVIAWESPGMGVMETDWVKNKSGKFALDKFRVRVEAGQTAGVTNLYLTHRGIQQAFVQGETVNVWGPRISDPELEAEVLGYLLEYLSLDKARSRQLAEQAAAQVAAANVKLDREAVVLLLNEPLKRAWTRVGLAMEREGYVIVDSLRDQGIYRVRSRTEEMKDKREESGMKEPRPAQQKQFSLKVTGEGEKSRVVVLDSGDKPDTSAFARDILARLQSQLL
ncbi:MAG: outer membrane protein assembly factor BamC [Gammaproteobacteria bacterium]|nr:outer membrane protein assembly factor BamC [Gammaproteobacteria bacterium]